ncbi:uncharacterized mitochondrial protein AtMg00860-like [Solanum tuberosum]|uniref:uncharacterized mitochondrial protein AtMg00860-like n=1 Tax=Solanum tuberosum TaxID=4113 RepID=UPI00073A0A84|nr:PREDICTED: uncharacterized mitochondrial protein AtMg00860-like [Solanum tuberosum]
MVDPQKIEAIKNYVRPSFMTEVRSFMGLDSNYRWFVKNIASIAMHFTSVTKKEVPFEWANKCEESFQKLKTVLTTTPILALPVEDLVRIPWFAVFRSSRSEQNVLRLEMTLLVA